MAGPLTWRDVAAPNFAPAMQGYQMFSDLLNNAFTSAERGLAKYDSTRNDAANRVAMFNAMTEQDPEKLKAKLQDGSLFQGVDLARLSPETIAAADSRVGTLLNRSLTEENLENTRYTNDRTQNQNAQRDAASTALAYLADAHRSGDVKRIAEAESKYGKAARAVPYQDLLPNMSALEGLENTALSQQGSRQNYNQSEITFAQGQQDRKDAEAATDYLSRSIGNSGGDPELLYGSIMSSDLTPGAKRQAIQQLGGFGSLMSTAAGANGGGGGGSASNSVGGVSSERVFNYEARGKGYSAMPDNITTLGGASDYQKQMNRNGVNSSAFGVYQIVGDTLRNYAPKVFGEGWRGQKLTVQAQDKIAEAIFNDNRGSAAALRKQWVSLSAAEAEQVRKMPWQQAREVIAQKESNSSPSRLLNGDPVTRNPAAGDASRITSMRNDINGVAAAFNNGWNADAKKVAIATELTKKGGVLEGGNAAQIADMIENIKQGSNVNDAVAGNILVSSLKRYKPADWKTLWGTTETVYGELAKGYTVDKEKLDFYTKQFRDNGVLRVQDRENRLTIDRAQLPVLAQEVQTLRARETRIANMGDRSRQSIENLNRVRAQREAAEQRLNALQGQIVGRERALRDSLQYKPAPGNSLFTVRPAGDRPKPRDDTDGSWFRIRRAGDK